MDGAETELGCLANEFADCRKVLIALGDENRQHLMLEMMQMGNCHGVRVGDDYGKISLNQQKPSKYAGLRRFSPEKFLQRSNEFMRERPIFYKNLRRTDKDFSMHLKCLCCVTKVVMIQFHDGIGTELARREMFPG